MPDPRKQAKEPPQPVVFIVDDDVSMREALTDLFRSMKFDAEAFDSATAFLEKANLNRPGCLLLDVRLPGISGLDFQMQLERVGNRMPIIFMTGFGDIPMSVQAVKNGAFDFLTKPVSGDDLLKVIASALLLEETAHEAGGRRRELLRREATLTPTEREVFRGVVAGQPNKMIAAELGCSERTVKAHRAQVMHKMAAGSLPELVGMAAEII